MKKLYIGLIAIFVVVLASTGYAFLDDFTNTPTADNVASDISNNISNDVSKDIGSNDLIKENDNSMSQVIAQYKENPIIETLEKYVSSTNNPKDTQNDDFTDKYLQCAVCGGFTPLGPVTKNLPADKLCNGECGGHINYNKLKSDSFNVYSYDEVMYILQYGKFPDSVQERVNQHEQSVKETINEILSHFKVLEGYNDTSVNTLHDFTDKYVKCCNCGLYIPLGNTTQSLPDEMICHESDRGHKHAYIDVNVKGVVSYDNIISNTTPEIKNNGMCFGSNDPNLVFSHIVNTDNLDTTIIYGRGIWDERAETNPYEFEVYPINNIEPINLPTLNEDNQNNIINGDQ